MIKNNTIDKYVIWLSKDEYEQFSKKYQMEKLSEYIINEGVLPDWKNIEV